VCQQAEAVAKTLADLGAVDRPVIVALNKIDRLSNPALAPIGCRDFPNSLPISATAGTGLADLLERIEQILAAGLVYLTVRIPYARGDLVALFHEHGTVVEESHSARGTRLKGYLSRRWFEQVRPFII
jgi:GTP-binding protein HflX